MRADYAVNQTTWSSADGNGSSFSLTDETIYRNAGYDKAGNVTAYEYYVTDIADSGIDQHTSRRKRPASLSRPTPPASPAKRPAIDRALVDAVARCGLC
ncbi:hypothetical protein GCM10027285_26950 [Oleiagrimonas citrea]